MVQKRHRLDRKRERLLNKHKERNNMPFTQYSDTALLNSIVGHTSSFGALGSAPNLWVGLSSTTPTADGNASNITEPSGGNYARVNATGNTVWTAATNAAPAYVVNGNAAITFGAATANWVSGSNLTYVVIFDASSTGNLLGFGSLTTAKPVLNGDTASFATSALNMTLQ